jgi:hypothetical protein
MPVTLDGGVDEVEDPTNLPPNVLVAATGCEYRVGSKGIFVAKGRQSLGSVSATVRGVYHAGFDGNLEYLIVHEGDNFHHALISDSMTFTSDGAIGSGSSPIIGTHYANRHYVVNGVSNHVYENVSGITHRSMGMAQPTMTLGVSATQGVGNMTVTTGLTYWLTEYDSTRGIESIYGTTSISTGAFSSKDSVVVTITGSKRNANANKYRAYRTTDGGVFPDGSLLTTIDSTATSFTDTNTSTSRLIAPFYGTIEIGGLDYDRDTEPPVLSVVAGPFEDSLLGFPQSAARSIRYSAVGRPESWPDGYDIPLQTERQDIGQCFGFVNGVSVAFTRDTVYRLSRLPRELDSAFAGGEVLELITNGSPDSLISITDGVNWGSRVDPDYLHLSRLITDVTNRQLVFYYRKRGQSNNTGIMYLDYQRQQIRVTHPDHGQIADSALAPFDGLLRLISADARVSNGTVYVEGTTTSDNGAAIAALIKTAEMFPGDTFDSVALGRAQWMHDASTGTAHHEFTFDRFSHGEVRRLNLTRRGVIDIGINREVNSLSLQISGSFTDSPGFHWYEIEQLERDPTTGEGA